MKQRTTLYTLAGAVDGEGVALAPASAVIECAEAAWPACTLLALGSPDEVAAHPAGAGAERVDRPDALLIPALVNAHTHLDLTHIGPRPFDPADGFDSWLRMILEERRTDPEGVADAVRTGVERSLEGGVVAVADVAGIGMTACVETLRESPLAGVSFLEVFGMGPRQSEAIGRMREWCDSIPIEDRAVRLGLSPHAPYTCGPEVYDAAASLARERGVAALTHLSESLAERRVVAEAAGPIVEMLRSLGIWDDAAGAHFGEGRSPTEHLERALGAAHWLVAHVNDASDADIAILARTGATVTYCPRASAYFGHHEDLGPHRYLDMLDAGVPVALGTDSIINLPPAPGGGAPSMSTLDEARVLRRRDGAEARTLLRLATTAGARALGLDPARFDLSPGAKAGLCLVGVGGADEGVPPGERLMDGDGRPVLVGGAEAG